MNLDKIQKEITNWIIKESSEKPKLEQNFLNDNIIDSFKFISLVMFCEKKFKVKFDSKDVEKKNFATVKVLSELIKNKIK